MHLRSHAALLALVVAVFTVGLPVVASAVPPPPRGIQTACPTGTPPSGFRDVPDANVHARAVDCVLAWGVTRGTSDTSYSPGASVSRGQMASFFRRLLSTSGAAMPSSALDAFGDDDGTTHESAVNDLAALGVVTGTAVREYSPSRAVTRAQMASFLVRTYEQRTGRSLPTAPDAFPDDQGNRHERAIDKAAAAGLTGGTGGGYSPDSPVRRDQMATFLSRLLDLLVEQGLAQPLAGPVVSPLTRPLTGAAADDVLAVDQVTGTVTLQDTAATAGLQPGTVLAAEIAPAVPNGLLARVVGRRSGPDGTVVLATEPAAFADVFPEGLGERLVRVEPLVETVELEPGVTLRQPAAAGTRQAATVVQGPTLRLQVDHAQGVTVDGKAVSVEVTGPLDVTPLANVRIDDRPSFSVGARVQGDLEFKAALGPSESLTIRLFKRAKIARCAFVSYVPVCVTGTMGLVLVVSATGEVTYEWRDELDGTVMGGVQAGSLAPLLDGTLSHRVTSLGPGAAVGVEALVGVRATAKLMDSAGLYTNVGSYWRLSTSRRVPVTCVRQDGWKGELGSVVEVPLIGPDGWLREELGFARRSLLATLDLALPEVSVPLFDVPTAQDLPCPLGLPQPSDEREPEAPPRPAEGLDTWSHPLGGAGRAGANEHETSIRADAVPRLQEAWTVPGASWPGDGASIAGDSAYATLGQDLTALDLDSGRVRWRASDRYRFPHDVSSTSSTPLLRGDQLYVRCGGVGVCAVSATGEALWRYTTGPFPDHLLVDDRRVYVTVQEHVVALDRASGRLIWSTELPRILLESGVLTGDALVVHTDGRLVALDPATGDTTWSVPTDSRAAELLTDGSQVYTCATFGGLEVFSGRTGAALWSTPSGTGCSSAAAAGGQVFVAQTGRSPGQTLAAYDGVSGAPRWQVPRSPSGGRAVARPCCTVVGDLLVVNNGTNMDLLRRRDGTLVRRLEAGGAELLGTPAVARGTIVAEWAGVGLRGYRLAGEA